jgi:hypothetical protein
VKTPKEISDYVHAAISPGAPAVYVDPRPGCYYVSVRDNGRTALLAGPFKTHSEALALVPVVRAKACQLDARGAWYAYGTARLPDDDSVPIRAGSLNKHLGLPA